MQTAGRFFATVTGDITVIRISRRELDEVKTELLRTQFQLWAIVRASPGHQVSVPQTVAESWSPRAVLLRIPSADGRGILFRAIDTNDAT
jgi:hypothetical protein